MLELMPLAILNLWRRNRRRTSLTMLAVATATVVFSVVMVIPYAINFIVSQAESSPRLVVVNKAGVMYGIPESYYRKILEVPGVVAANRMTWFGGIYDDPKHQFPTMALDAENPDQIWPEYGMDRATVEGFKSSRDSAVVGVATMHRFGWKIGQTVVLRSQIYPLTLSFRVSGIYDKGPDLTAFMFHRDYLEEALHNPGRVDMVWVKCATFKDTSRVAAGIDEEFRNSGAETETSTEQAFMRDFIARFRPLARIVEGIGLCAVVAIALAVLNATAMSMRERRVELAVLRSLGFVAPQLLAAVALEGGAIAMLGGIAGVGLATVLLNLAQGYVPALGPLLSFGMPRPLMAGGLTVALAIGMVATIIPAILATRESVISALRRVA